MLHWLPWISSILLIVLIVLLIVYFATKEHFEMVGAWKTKTGGAPGVSMYV
jgi:hypothetical protein